MTKIGRIIGGFLALTGAGFTLFTVLTVIGTLSIDPLFTVPFVITLGLAVLAIVGGILLLVDKTIGGILPIIAGAVLIIGYWIIIGSVGMKEIPLAIHWAFVYGPGYYIDPLLAIAGGIVGLVVGSK